MAECGGLVACRRAVQTASFAVGFPRSLPPGALGRHPVGPRLALETPWWIADPSPAVTAGRRRAPTATGGKGGTSVELSS